MSKTQTERTVKYVAKEKGYDPISCAYRQMGRNYIDAVIRKMLMWHTGDSSMFCDVIQTLPGAYNNGYKGWVNQEYATPFDSMLVTAGKEFMNGNFQYLAQVETWIWKYVIGQYSPPTATKQSQQKSAHQGTEKFMYKLQQEEEQENQKQVENQHHDNHQQLKKSSAKEESIEKDTKKQKISYSEKPILTNFDYDEEVDFYLRSVACPKTELDLFCHIMRIKPPKINRTHIKNSQWVVSGKIVLEAGYFAYCELILQAQATHQESHIAMGKMALRMLKTLFHRLPEQWKYFRNQKKGKSLLC